MKDFYKIVILVTILLGLTWFPGSVFAQEDATGTSPKPAARALPPLGENDTEKGDQSSDSWQPDTRPLTGIQQLTLGTPPERHSYWIPGISLTNLTQSNALAQGGTNGWSSTGYATGNLSLLDDWGTSRLSVNYSGGGYFSSETKIGNGQFHQLGVEQEFDWRRVQVTLLDEFAYLPESQFGFAAGSSIALPGSGGPLAPVAPGLQGGSSSGQSIFTATGARYTDYLGTQVNLLLSRRSSITLGGVIGVLRFVEPGNIESNQVILSAGYNYEVSKTDTLGLSYNFGAFHYIGYPQAIGFHVIQAMYGKRITGRLALQLSGGPQITEFRVPPGGNGKTRYLSGNGAAGLVYAFSAGSFSLDYAHGVTNGSGVLLGATSDRVTGSAVRRLSRIWSGNLSLGFAHNKNAASSSSTQDNTYDTLFLGAGLKRPLSRSMDFTLNYTAYIQTTSTTVCAGPNCGTDFTTHQISVGLSWRSRPFVLH